ncbi:MAG: T9SS type A sorting domain-containing protein [Chitinophagaceae bacterium]|nr:T9SS type A sorting domain-containing protein [Chitinophagaceae bacterium]
MKKFTLTFTGLLLASVMFAQTTVTHQPPTVRPEHYKGPTLVPGSFAGNEQMPVPTQSTTSTSPIGQTQTIRDFTEAVIGTTFYDLQSNNAISDRLVYNSSTGTVSAAWTFSAGNQATDRGTGYNFYDGTAWGTQPTERVESERTGFTNICIPSSGIENVMAHNTTSFVMQHSYRASAGTGAWTESLTDLENDAVGGNLWSKVATNGNNVHLISLTTPTGNGGALYNGLNGTPMYYRSTDGGTTWDKTNVELPDITSENYIGFAGDAYQIDANGNTVAIVVGGSISNDVLLYKSTDNGDTWTKTIVYQHPYFKFTDDTITDMNNDGVADSIRIADGSFAILVDNSGMVHLWWGDMFILNDIVGDAAYSYYFTNALMYWDENMTDATMIENLGSQDLDQSGYIEFNDIGTFPFKGLTSYPSAAIDVNGNIYLSYMAVVENSSDPDGKSMRHIYVSVSQDNGESWADPIDVVSDEFAEGAYACLARTVDDNVRLIYQRDFCAGISTTSGNPDPCNAGVENEIVYVSLPVFDLGIDVGVPGVNTSDASISVYPNPSTGFTTLAFNKLDQNDVSISVTNSIGRTVMTLNAVKVNNNKTDLDLSGMENGIYYVNIKSANSNTTIPLTLLNK